MLKRVYVEDHTDFRPLERQLKYLFDASWAIQEIGFSKLENAYVGIVTNSETDQFQRAQLVDIVRAECQAE